MKKITNGKGVAIRVNPNLKTVAEKTLKSLGLNMHAGINLLLTQMVLIGRVPFAVTLEHPELEIITDELTIPLQVKADEETKKKCVNIAHSAGLNLSHVITMYLVQIVDKQAIPFEILSSPEKSEA